MLLRKQVSLSQADKLEKEHFYSSLYHLFFLCITIGGRNINEKLIYCHLESLLPAYLLFAQTNYSSNDVWLG